MIWFKFNDKQSDTEGLILKEIPTRFYPEKRIERIQIPNRDGYLYQEEEAYDTFILSVEFTIKNRANINSVFSWLNGEGKLYFSDFSDRYYNARVVNAPTFQRMLSTFGKCQIQFECMPFSNKAVDSVVLTENTDDLTITTLAPIQPTLKLIGTGNYTITINNVAIVLTGVENPAIDCKLGMLIEDGSPANSKMNGDARNIKLVNGNNFVSIIGTYTSLEIEYEERWL